MHFQSLLTAPLTSSPRSIFTGPSGHYPMPIGWIDSTAEDRRLTLSFGDRLARLRRSWLLPFLIGATGGLFIWLPDALAAL